jgi:hypothetical protein
MLEVYRSIWPWRKRWHVYDVDTGGTRWVASFLHEADAIRWVDSLYRDDQ